MKAKHDTLTTLGITIGKILVATGELRTQPAGRLRFKVSTQKQMRRALMTPKARRKHRFLLRANTGCLNLIGPKYWEANRAN